MTLIRVDRTYPSGKQTHWYMLDGVRADGVTTVISKALPKPALTAWAARSVAEFVADNQIEVSALWGENRDRMVNELKGTPYRERDAAANRGTEVHALAEKLVKGEAVEVPGELAGYVDAYVKFLDEWSPKPVLVEAAVGNRRWNLAGTLDLVAELPGGEIALMDVKTSKGVYPEVALQLAAYANAEFYMDNGAEVPMSSLGIQSGYVIHVRDGSYAVHPVDISADGPWKVMQHLVWLSRKIGDAMKPWLGDPATLPIPGATNLEETP
jgi:hypothetical protein